MRALVGVADNPLMWFEGGANARIEDVRLWIRELRKDGILISDSSKRELLSRVASTQDADNFRSILVDFISEQPSAVGLNPLQADFLVGEKKPFSQLSAEIMGQIVELAVARSEEFAEGTTMEDAYERTIGLFIKLVKSVIIVDPYAGSSVISRDKRRSWLIEKLLKDGISELHVVTSAAESRETFQLSPSQIRDLIEESFRKLVGRHSRGKSKIVAEIYELNKKIFHHRRIGFKFDSGWLFFSLESGIDGFALGEVIPGTAFNEVSSKSFETYVRAIRSNLRRI